jgi:C4-dicarboxylate transporter DctM subunit
MVASVYILVVLIPILRPRHIWQLPGDFIYTGLLYSLPLALVAAASAFGWMLAYLRGPDAVADLISHHAGTDPVMIMFLLVLLFVLVGDFIDAVPAIIIFMPIINKLTELGNIKPVHMGVVIITTLVFGLITPPYGLCLLVASKFVGVPFNKALVRSLPLYGVFIITISFVVLFPEVVLWLPKQFLPQSVGCFPNPSGAGYICPP